MKTRLLLSVLVATLMLTACQSFQVEPIAEPLRAPKPLAQSAQAEQIKNAAEQQATSQTRFSRPPHAGITRTQALGIADQLGANLKGDPINVSFNEVPLIAFINEVFGNQLGLSFVIAPGLAKKNDLVTLRLTEALPPAELFQTVRSVLEQYGVGFSEENGVLTFVVSKVAVSDDIPLLSSGRALPDVPSSHRVIFQLVPLRVVRNPSVAGWLKQIFKGHLLTVLEDPTRNAVLLKGSLPLVTQAVEMIEVLDQPLMKGRYSMIVHPVYLEAEVMAKQLDKVLRAEGYETAINSVLGSIVFLPLDEANKLLVFAADEAALKHVKAWVRELDEKQQKTITEGTFTYEVQNTQAKNLITTLNALRGGVAGKTADKSAEKKTSKKSDKNSGSAQGLVMDENRNLLIFRGSGKEWGELLEVIEVLDKPAASVLVEVVLAEITLTDEQGSGLEFAFNSMHGKYNLTGGTLDALGVSSKGLSMVLDRAGDVRAALNFFYEDSRVMIRSSPKLLVKSGESAEIEVGNEIPVITQTSEDGTITGGTSNILQEVSYRKTGVLLNIKPVVQAGGLVDLEISQELSEARPTASTSLEGSPTILNRKVKTNLTLRDGSSLLMGGIISSAQSSGQNGILGLGKLPIIGRLFRNDSFQKDRTELLIMVTPYVVVDHHEGSDLTERFKQQLKLHKKYSSNVINTH